MNKLFLFLAILACLPAIGQKLKLKEGKKAPLFTLKTNDGKQFSLQETLADGKQVILVFYQGAWNEYDVKYLKKLQEKKNDIDSKNAVVILVSRETFNYSNKLREKEGIEFINCRDADWSIMAMYGVPYKMSKGNLPLKYKEYSLKNERHTGFKDDIVPVPATWVIGTDQKVKYVHFDLDYRQHPPVTEILNAL